MQAKQNNLLSGQSLVEVAIVMPIILLLMAGVVEISNLLIAQNRVVTGTRAATSFGTVNFREEALPDGWADAMAGVALNTVSNTPQGDNMLWEFAIVRARTNADGDGFERWEAAYPNGTTPEHMPGSAELQSDVLSELGGGQNAAGLDLLITVAHSEYESLLQLNNLFNIYPDKLTAINVGMIDKEQEPVIFCLDESEPGAVRVEYAVDIAGDAVALETNQRFVYRTLRTWSGGQQEVDYNVENLGYRIAFSGSNLGRPGAVETDRFTTVVSGSPTQVGARISTVQGVNMVILDLQAGQSAISPDGFTVTVANVTTLDAGSKQVTMTLTSSGDRGGRPAILKDVIFKFVGSECSEWGPPQDTGDYSGTLGP